MIKIKTLPAIAAALLAFGLAAAPAQAGPNRTFVSGTGTDSGTCTRTAPCRTFAFAITVTNAGGEIDVLDPAGYGPVTITKAIGIVNDGVGVAAIGAGSGNGVTINAGATDSVHLRGLTIEGLGSGANGILFKTGGNLAVENCVVRGFSNAGIKIAPTTLSSFSVSNTIASNNGSLSGGILIKGPVTGVLSKVTANNNQAGIVVDQFAAGGLLNVTIVDSEASNNDTGILAQSTSRANVMVRNVVVSGNSFFGLSEFGTNVWIAHSVFAGNNTGVGVDGQTRSYGDNDISGNALDVEGTLTPVATR